MKQERSKVLMILELDLKMDSMVACSVSCFVAKVLMMVNLNLVCSVWYLACLDNHLSMLERLMCSTDVS